MGTCKDSQTIFKEQWEEQGGGIGNAHIGQMEW